jgi:hypothetical protein
MSFADDVEAYEQQPAPVKYCKTGQWVNDLDTRDREAFKRALSRGGPVSDLHRIAINNGCTAAETRFRAHCRRRCSCYINMEVAA